MFLTLHGTVTRPAVTTAVTWDPFTPYVANFARLLAARARTGGWSAVPMLLDPAPPALRNGEPQWPFLHDVPTRVQLLLDCGAEAVAVVGFRHDDLTKGAGDLFDVVGTGVRIAEFWLRRGQSLGSGPEGSPEGVLEAAARRGFPCRFVRQLNQQAAVAVRDALLAGGVARAARYVGTYPTLRQPRSGAVRLAWQAGTYRAIPADSPSASVDSAPPIDVALVPSPRGMALLDWPDRAVEYLRFVRGPGDVAAAVPQAAIA
jgi:hypothetical protein